MDHPEAARGAEPGVEWSMRPPGGTTLLLLACVVLARPAAAEMSDAAYCAKLTELTLRYTGKVGLEGELSPTKTTVVAIDGCKKGNFADSIPVLEKVLRDNRITLPAR
jgi:hypothetical protein